VALYGARTSGSITLSASATKSLWLLNPATDFFVLAQFAVSFNASASSSTVAVELYRTTTLGSPTGTTATFAKVNRVGDAAAPTTTGLVNLTAEPTAVEVLADWEIQPFGGVLDIQYPMQREPIAASAGQRIGLRCTTPAATTPGVRSYVWFDER
jgi:hypothetical protein